MFPKRCCGASGSIRQLNDSAARHSGNEQRRSARRTIPRVQSGRLGSATRLFFQLRQLARNVLPGMKERVGPDPEHYFDRSKAAGWENLMLIK